MGVPKVRPDTKLRRGIGWTFCIFFGLLVIPGLISLDSPFMTMGMLSLSLMAAPPFRKFIYRHHPRTLAADFNLVMIGVLVLFTTLDRAFISDERLQDKVIAEFKYDREEIMADLKAGFDRDAYPYVMEKAQPYLGAGDAELTALYEQAKEAQDRITSAKEEAERKATTEKLVSLLKTIPASEIHRNRTLYARLVSMNPDNEAFQAKLNYYATKVRERQAKERAAEELKRKAFEERLALFGDPPEQLSWDGSYLPVRIYLDQVARDPDSVEFINCTDVSYYDEGWLVGCDFRARNGFGGMTIQSNWFTIRHDTVVNVHEVGAFRALN